MVDAGPMPDGMEPTGEAVVFAVAGDFAGTGIASTVAIPSLEVQQNVVAGVASDDPVVRKHGENLYIINRFGHNNITILDASSYALVAQISTGPGSNPHDVAVRGSTIYVAAHDSPGVLLLDAARPGAGAVETVDLSALDPDGIPNCTAIYMQGDTILAVCGVLDASFDPRGPGQVAVIDSTDNALRTSFALSTPNPIGRLVATPPDSVLGGDLLIGTVDFAQGLTSGCIERITMGPSPSSLGCLIDNETLGGYATAYQVGSDDKLYIAVTTGYDAMGAIGHLATYDLVSETLSEPVSPPDQRINGLVRCPTGHWVLTDAAGGLRVYSAAGDELTTGLLDIGLPPGSAICY